MTNRSANQNGNVEPRCIEQVIGQGRVVERLKVSLEASVNDAAPVESILMTGPPGLGKTMVASLLAREVASPLHQTVGAALASSSQINAFLMTPQDREIAFIDEIHTLNSVCQHVLLRALEDGKIFVAHDASQKPIEVDLARFSLLAATTDEHALIRPLRDRFKLVLPFEHYGKNELHNLLTQRCARLGWDVPPSALIPIAQRGLGTPRLAVRLLEAARRITRAAGETRTTRAHVERAVAMEGLDSLGLGPSERSYLDLMKAAQRPLRLNVLASSLGLPSKTITEVIEPTLLRLGLIVKDDKGRMLTEQGVNHICSQAPRKA